MKKFFCALVLLIAMVVLGVSAASADTIIDDSLSVGDRFYMGYYEQDNNYANGREPIEWVVLEVNRKQGTALVISGQALDCMQYHPWSGAIRWADSGVRLWLNQLFFFWAFNPQEQACIDYTTGSSVVDHVTMLDANQIKKFKLDKNGCDATPYARARGVQVGNDNGKSCWWVRNNVTASNGRTQFVGIHGKVYGSNEVTVSNNGVRPAMTVLISELANCPRLDTYRDREIPNYGFANQKIATRCGPATSFDEIHTYEVAGWPVLVRRYEVTNGTPWVEIEFLYQGEWLRVWTGLKRVDHARISGLPGDYYLMGHGTLTCETEGWYGPGDEYRVVYHRLPAGTAVEIMGEENGWYQIQYVGDKKLTIRTWVPGYAVAVY